MSEEEIWDALWTMVLLWDLAAIAYLLFSTWIDSKGDDR